MTRLLGTLIAALFAVATVGAHAASHSGGTPAKAASGAAAKGDKAQPKKAADGASAAKKGDAKK